MSSPSISRMPLVHPRDARVATQQRRSLDRFLQHLPSAPAPVIERLWVDADGLLAEAHMLKDGDRCTVVRIEHAGRPMVLKRYNLKGSVHTAVHSVMRSRAAWCWRSGIMLMQAKVLTPRPLAYVEERRAGVLRRRSYLLTEFVAGVTLRDHLEPRKNSTAPVRDCADQFVKIWQDLGALRLGHGDMKASNFIVDPGGLLWLIDLDGMRTYRAGPMLRAERRKDITRFMRNWQEWPDVAAVFRARIGTS